MLRFTDIKQNIINSECEPTISFSIDFDGNVSDVTFDDDNRDEVDAKTYPAIVGFGSSSENPLGPHIAIEYDEEGTYIFDQ